MPMNLILWRHAEAEEATEDTPDRLRRLTPRGRKQAVRVAKWLGPRLPERFVLLSSPAERARTTAEALELPFEIDDRLSPEADAAELLAACGWPDGIEGSKGTVIVVGHQPTLGRVASLLLSGTEADWTVRKGAAWWLSTRDRDGAQQVVLRAVIGPDQA